MREQGQTVHSTATERQPTTRHRDKPQTDIETKQTQPKDKGTARQTDTLRARDDGRDKNVKIST